MAKMRCRVHLTLVALFSVLAVASLIAQNALGPLGVQEVDAKRHALWGLTSNQVAVSLGAKAFKAADSTARVRLVQGALSWFKAYTESASFKAEYAKQRESNKPSAPKPRESVENELAKQKVERNKNMEQSKQNMAKMPPEMRHSMEASIKQMEEMYARNDANPQMAAMMRKSLEMQRADEDRLYQERLAQYEKKFPADPRILIARRLQEFLDVSQSVDFNAQLQTERRIAKFVNPAFEEKPDNWKLCFRAGKPAVDAARAFAATWLRELQAK